MRGLLTREDIFRINTFIRNGTATDWPFGMDKKRVPNGRRKEGSS